MIEKLFFNLLATILFIIVFFKMARKNNTTYISLLVVQAIGIAINFLEINFNIFVQWPFKVVEYVFSIILPIIVLYLERKNIINFPEIIALIMDKYYTIIKDNEKNKKMLLKLINKRLLKYIANLCVCFYNFLFINCINYNSQSIITRYITSSTE